MKSSTTLRLDHRWYVLVQSHSVILNFQHMASIFLYTTIDLRGQLNTDPTLVRRTLQFLDRGEGIHEVRSIVLGL